MAGLDENIWIDEGLVCQMMGLEVIQDDLDVVEFGRLFRQPPDCEPVGALGKRRRGRLADMDRAVVEHENDGLEQCPGFRTLGAVESVHRGDEAGAAAHEAVEGGRLVGNVVLDITG